jgi:hypothetical protein
MYHLTTVSNVTENPTDLVINGGYFSNQGNTTTVDGVTVPVNNPAEGYEWKQLDPAETLEVNGTTLSFGYQVVKSAE